MKTIKTFGLLLGAALLASGLTGCENMDYPDRFQPTDGVPTVYGIRYAATGVHIDQAFMEETVCILGENLKSVHDVYFNDQAATLNTSFMTDKTLLVQVPKTMPVVETDKIYLVTANKDTVKTDFRVLPPVPRVREMSFEYAEPGKTVTIFGNYFYQKPGGTPLTIEFPNATVSEIKEIALDHVTFVVPEGAMPGKVKVTTASGTSASEFIYKDDRGLLFDFDGTNGLYTVNKGWHPVDVVEGGVSGMCLKLGDKADTFSCDGGDWHDGKYHFEYWAGNYADPEDYGTWDGRRLFDVVDFKNFATMALKFEVKINPEDAWTGCPMQIIFSDVTLVSNNKTGTKDIYGTVLGGQNNTYFNNKEFSLPRYLWRPWRATGSFDTAGEWMTVTIPIADFTQFWDDTKATGKLTPESFANLEFFFAGGTNAEGKPCSPILYIDNVRAVPVR